MSGGRSNPVIIHQAMQNLGIFHLISLTGTFQSASGLEFPYGLEFLFIVDGKVFYFNFLSIVVFGGDRIYNFP